MGLTKKAAISKKCYVIRVITNKEKKYISCIERELSKLDGRILWPRRSLVIRKSGVKTEKVSSLYPGYLFWETTELTAKSIMILKKAFGFVRFLKSDFEIIPISEEERYLLHNLISGGEVIRQSRVVFDEESRIRVVDGPMKGMEGAIVKVDRRKGRAKVMLSFYGRSFLVDLGFEVMDFHPEELYRNTALLYGNESVVPAIL